MKKNRFEPEVIMQAGLVSVMMPAYNAEQYIGQAIESVLAQNYPHWELIIVDDGSTDRTVDVAFSFTDPRIKIIHQDNSGESAARNTALKHMQGEFVAFLDADDIFLPDHLEVTLNYLLSHPDRDAVYTDGHYCNQSGLRIQTLSSRRRGPFEGRVYEEAVYGSDVFGPPVCVVLRRNIITQNNLVFDEAITIGPDWDFFVQYSDLAIFGYLTLHTCLYRLHHENITFRIDLEKRALEMAKCREKAIRMKNFQACSLDTQWNVFYDLLVNLLLGFPEHQAEVTQWQEFNHLPSDYQARLFRLMAREGILHGIDSRLISEWLHSSRRLNSADWRGGLVFVLYHLSPSLCEQLLRLFRPKYSRVSPFSDMNLATTA
jgi:glycosyltransferase involved in cell wall biosynthesis